MVSLPDLDPFHPPELLVGKRGDALLAATLGVRAFVVEQAVQCAPGDHPNPPHGVLSPREVEVLQLSADGLSRRQVGHRLGISEFTVKSHMHNISNTLGAATRPQAIAYAYRQGAIT